MLNKHCLPVVSYHTMCSNEHCSWTILPAMQYKMHCNKMHCEIALVKYFKIEILPSKTGSDCIQCTTFRVPNVTKQRERGVFIKNKWTFSQEQVYELFFQHHQVRSVCCSYRLSAHTTMKYNQQQWFSDNRILIQYILIQYTDITNLAIGRDSYLLRKAADA